MNLLEYTIRQLQEKQLRKMWRRFFDMLIGRKILHQANTKGPFTLGKMDVSNDLLSKLIMELKSLATFNKSDDNMDTIMKFFDELTNPSCEIPVPSFFCDNEGEVTYQDTNIGKVESKPWKPQCNERVLYKFRKDSEFKGRHLRRKEPTVQSREQLSSCGYM